ncbi:SRPBCC family protein [Streptomyces atratus]|uniref:Carbon monoxide dehydrogenase subunit G n=1 Tax=Streptomyces atratus TaxID=1893 RepID=A0A1K1Y2U4_STRAR|nr:SRPBCC family protein [Streptomyces atratus]SFX56199.1 Carbon monoxide dehydrogenase subunit G [Streptomyces atratus]
MQLQNSFTVPVPVDEAWRALLDIEHVSQCMPGATVEEFDGDTVKGSVKVRVGPITVTYRGTATFLEKDDTAHRMVLSARGNEVRGQGTASATVTAVLTDDDGGTTVSVTTDLTFTGRPAQFGRGVMSDVGDALVGRFADCLGRRLSAAEPSAPAQPVADTADTAPTGGAEPIDLLRTVGGPVAGRAAGAAAVAALAVLGVLLARRCCRGCRCGGACRTCHTR